MSCASGPVGKGPPAPLRWELWRRAAAGGTARGQPAGGGPSRRAHHPAHPSAPRDGPPPARSPRTPGSSSPPDWMAASSAPAVRHASVTTTTEVRRATREQAEEHLRALVGRDDAVLREDQWSAIEALAVDRRRSLVVQRTGWGKSAVYFVATAAAARAQGAGPTVIVSPLLALMRNQIAAAERAGIRAVTINSTNIEDWEPIQDVDPRRRGRRPAGQPRAAQQPRLPRRGAAPAGRDLRAAGRRRGALHLRLGPRLPARLPADPHPARRPPRRHPGARHHRDRQRAGDRRRRRADSGTDVLVLRGSLDRESLRLGVVRLQDRPAAPGLAGRPPRRAARLRHRLLPDRRRHPGDRRLPALARPRRRGLLRPDRDRPSVSALEQDLAGRPGQGAGRHQRARHGLRRRPSASWSTWGRPPPRSPTTSRSAAPAAAPTRPTVVLLPGDRGPRHLGLLRLARLPARGAGPPDPRRARPTRAAR